MILPRVSTNLLSGLLETVAGPPYNGKADLPDIASALHMEVDDLFPVAETLQMLRFAEIEGGDMSLSEEGRRFAAAPLAERKRLFAHHLVTYVPLAAHIRRILDVRAGARTPKRRFRDELEDHMRPAAAEQSLRAVIGWGRYAEVFAYDDGSETFSLENPQ
jgi:NitT/TauT family transport system ATP-binding protein